MFAYLQIFQRQNYERKEELFSKKINLERKKIEDSIHNFCTQKSSTVEEYDKCSKKFECCKYKKSD